MNSILPLNKVYRISCIFKSGVITWLGHHVCKNGGSVTLSTYWEQFWKLVPSNIIGSKVLKLWFWTEEVILMMAMMQSKQGFSKHKTIMIGVQVFIAALAAETDKDIKHLVYNPIGQQCSDWAFESGGSLLSPDHCRKK